MVSASFDRFVAAIGELRKTDEIRCFLQELLTPGEVHDLALRWELVELLSSGVSQRQISAQLGISLCKITRGAKILKKRNGVVSQLVLRGKGASEERETPKRSVRNAQMMSKPRKVVKKHGTRIARKS